MRLVRFVTRYNKNFGRFHFICFPFRSYLEIHFLLARLFWRPGFLRAPSNFLTNIFNCLTSKLMCKHHRNNKRICGRARRSTSSLARLVLMSRLFGFSVFAKSIFLRSQFEHVFFLFMVAVFVFGSICLPFVATFCTPPQPKCVRVVRSINCPEDRLRAPNHRH